MLVPFTTDAKADTMFGDVALAMLKKRGTAQPCRARSWRQMFLRPSAG